LRETASERAGGPGRRRRLGACAVLCRELPDGDRDAAAAACGGGVHYAYCIGSQQQHCI
jgi:hypothetical protein